MHFDTFSSWSPRKLWNLLFYNSFLVLYQVSGTISIHFQNYTWPTFLIWYGCRPQSQRLPTRVPTPPGGILLTASRCPLPLALFSAPCRSICSLNFRFSLAQLGLCSSGGHSTTSLSSCFTHSALACAVLSRCRPARALLLILPPRSRSSTNTATLHACSLHPLRPPYSPPCSASHCRSICCPNSSFTHARSLFLWILDRRCTCWQSTRFTAAQLERAIAAALSSN